MILKGDVILVTLIINVYHKIYLENCLKKIFIIMLRVLEFGNYLT